MTYRSRRFVRLVFAPIVAMVAYYIIIFLAVETGYTLHGEEYLEHEGEIVLIEAISGIFIFAICIRRADQPPQLQGSVGRAPRL